MSEVSFLYTLFPMLNALHVFNMFSITNDPKGCETEEGRGVISAQKTTEKKGGQLANLNWVNRIGFLALALHHSMADLIFWASGLLSPTWGT